MGEKNIKLCQISALEWELEGRKIVSDILEKLRQKGSVNNPYIKNEPFSIDNFFGYFYRENPFNLDRTFFWDKNKFCIDRQKKAFFCVLKRRKLRGGEKE